MSSSSELASGDHYLLQVWLHAPLFALSLSATEAIEATAIVVVPVILQCSRVFWKASLQKRAGLPCLHVIKVPPCPCWGRRGPSERSMGVCLVRAHMAKPKALKARPSKKPPSARFPAGLIFQRLRRSRLRRPLSSSSAPSSSKARGWTRTTKRARSPSA